MWSLFGQLAFEQINVIFMRPLYEAVCIIKSENGTVNLTVRTDIVNRSYLTLPVIRLRRPDMAYSLYVL